MAFNFDRLRADADNRRAMDPAALEQLEAREEFARNARHVVNDDDMRVGNSLELRVVTLAAHPDMRYSDSRKDVTGEQRTGAIMYMVSHDDGRPFDGTAHQDLKRSMYYPSEAERLVEESRHGSGLDAHVEGLRSGSKVSMLGKEVSRNWKDGSGAWKTVKEFHAMRMGPGEMTREQLSSLDPGGLVAASRRYFRAETELERDAIARERLGQEPAKSGLSAQAATVGDARIVEAKGPALADGAGEAYAVAAARGSDRSGR
jgi:hypothetical protein